MEKLWDGIYGQDKPKELLSNLLNSSKIPHAFLFLGIEGTGKDFLAIRFAQALNLKFTNKKNSQEIIHSISKLNEPYIKYIIPLPRGKNETDESSPLEKLSNDDIQLLKDELQIKILNPYYKISLPKAQGIKINSIRDIKKFLALNYSDLMYRVILISDAHLMNEPAQNALLKNLEEPPEGVIFILATPYPALLKDTIISRCWKINFQPLSEADIKEILVKYFNKDEHNATEVAPFSNGSVVNALNLLENDFEKLRDKTILILRYSFGRKFDSALKEFFSLLSDDDPDSIKLVIQMIIAWLNDIEKFRFGQGNYFYSGHIETLSKFNEKFPDIRPQEIVAKLDRFSSMIKNNININLIALNIILELASLTANKS
jgi:DNA polymerase-3 subunit delta'